jgi:ribonuclease HII
MLELDFIANYPQEIIATDEVGRGPLGGPVVIGAIRFMINNKASFKGLLKFLRVKGIKDSKKLTCRSRVSVLKNLGFIDLSFRDPGCVELKGIEIDYLTWEMDHEAIDLDNILGASLKGMKEASLQLSKWKNKETTVLIDGHQKFRWGKELSPWNEIPLVKGDSKSPLIGLASIIAKEKRDAYMREMHELYPQYGFNSHFGYPTKEHREAIKKHGPCLIHRKTFKGVREYLRA